MYLYFAGAEAHCPRLYENGVRRMLASFYYIWRKRKGKGFKYMENMFSKYGKSIRWFMDSGAFTLQQERKDVDNVDCDSFLDDYIYSLKQWKNYIECAVELDLDNFMGMGWVLYARQRIINETGITPLLVHHLDTRSFPEFKKNCKQYPYIGFSIGDGDLFYTNKFLPYYFTARQTKTKLHAFGITQPFILMKYHFYSCDSFSWSMGAKFGTTFENVRGQMNRHNNYEKHIRRKFISQLQRWGIPVQDVLNDKYIPVDRFNTIQWILCEQDINKRHPKPYWNEPREGMNTVPDKIGLRSKLYDSNDRLINPLPINHRGKRVVNLKKLFSRSDIRRKGLRKKKELKDEEA